MYSQRYELRKLDVSTRIRAESFLKPSKGKPNAGCQVDYPPAPDSGYQFQNQTDNIGSCQRWVVNVKNGS